MAYKQVKSLLHRTKYITSKQTMAMHLRVAPYHRSEDFEDEPSPSECDEKALFAKLTKLTHMLKHVDLIDGRLVNTHDHYVVVDDCLQQSMQTFKSLARVFIGSPIALQPLIDAKAIPFLCFGKSCERQTMNVNSLTQVCNFLNISAQQRKTVRLQICPQVTTHQIWAGALEEILTGLKSEIEHLIHSSPTAGTRMAQQIVSSCLNFLNIAISYNPDSTSWMRLAPAKVSESPVSHKWEDVLEMFNDLMNCLRDEKKLLFHFTKLEDMREGLSQIKDVLIDKNIAYREVRHQESLVQKKLTRTLGQSSRCLFTLLLYYLYGSVVDIEVDIRGGIYESGGKDKFCLCMGKILTSNDEKTVQRGVKQLDRALGLFKFVREMAGMKGDLELQGHLWCVGVEGTSLSYRGNRFFVHGINHRDKTIFVEE